MSPFINCSPPVEVTRVRSVPLTEVYSALEVSVWFASRGTNFKKSFEWIFSAFLFCTKPIQPVPSRKGRSSPHATRYSLSSFLTQVFCEILRAPLTKTLSCGEMTNTNAATQVLRRHHGTVIQIYRTFSSLLPRRVSYREDVVKVRADYLLFLLPSC